MTEYRADRDSLVGVEERRGWAEEYRFDKDKKTGDYILQGYAATYEPYDCHGGPNAGGWIEQLDQRAFDTTLASQPDVQLLINHTGEPLARTKSGTLKLSRDQHGLKVWARLDPSDPDVQRLAPKMIRKDMDEMSFAFRVSEQDWDTNYTTRTIRALSLEKGDVSVVNYGMNPTTQAALSETVDALAQLSNRELVELRKLDLDPNALRRAAQALATISARPEAPMGTTGANLPVRADDPKEPYGDVTYADPGYKSDGKKRYPISSAEKVRAAWSYINMPKNQKGYTSGQVASIKGRIKSAAKKFGVTISDSDAKSLRSLADVAYIEQGMVAVMSDGSRVPLPSETRAGEGFKPVAGTWSPADVTAGNDPHDAAYGNEVGFGPVPDNIIGSKTGAKFDGTPQGESHPDTTHVDPHDQALQEEMLAMDNHDDPYDVGPQVGGVEGDRPNVGDFPQGKVAPNIITSGTALGHSDCDPGTPPSVGTEPVDGPAKHDWTSGTISEPDDPAQELDAAVEAREGDWSPTNIEGDTSDDPDAEIDSHEHADNPHDGQIDVCMADALDRTIIHCYKIAGDNMELRKGLAAARRQLKMLRGVAPSEENSEINRKLSELRAEVGETGSGTVSDGLAFLRSAGSAPIGYRGVLDADPAAHVTTPGEKLLKEARISDAKAKRAAAEAETAAARVKAAQREAELTDVLRRHARKAI